MATAPFTRERFEKACKAYMAKSEGSWTWHEHSIYRMGYLSRQAVVHHKTRGSLLESDTDDLDGDDWEYLEDVEPDDAVTTTAAAASDMSHRPPAICQQYVVYSATFQVPAFYFSISDASGSPLSLEGILETSLLRKDALPTTVETSAFAVTAPNSSFPLLSQGEHPVLGTPCWYFHPCETPGAVEEIMAELDTKGWSEEDRLVRWMYAWFMVLGTTVNLG